MLPSIPVFRCVYLLPYQHWALTRSANTAILRHRREGRSRIDPLGILK